MAYRRTAEVEARLAAVRARIIEATTELVAGGGWGAATIVAAAEQAEIATGTVYRHFATKDELFAEVFRRAAGRELDRVTAAASAPGTAARRIDAALRTFAERALRGRRLAYALLAEPAAPAVEAERLVYRQGYRSVFAEVLDLGIAAGELAPHDTALAAAALTGAMGEALVGPLAPIPEAFDRATSQTRVDDLVAWCLRALPTTTSTATSTTTSTATPTPTPTTTSTTPRPPKERSR
jgi:AcrR family transcriptional regulator